MIKVLSAHTREIDLADAAVNEILEQLDVEHRLLAHSAGVLYYYPDFAGVVKKLCERLPFPVLGGTTSNSAVPGTLKSGSDAGGDIILTMTVFTSDTIAFSAGISEPLGDDPRLPVEKLYRQLMASAPEKTEKPAMLFLITPRLLQIPGDDYLAVLDSLSGGVPVFGSIAFTHSADFRDIRSCFNGEEYASSLGILAFWGDYEPRFFHSIITDDRMINRRATISESHKNRIRRINGIPAVKYFETIGLAQGGEIMGVDSFPLILHLKDGSRLVRTVLAVEEGEILCSGAVPPHVPVDFSFCGKDFVVSSAKKTLLECSKWLRDKPCGGVLIISCAARRWTLGADVNAELRGINRILGEASYHFAYSAGEFCPVEVKKGLKNSFCNYSMCICAV
ncbi:MAG: FIST C-terminal domain-containing protein [Treponema sp.]|jgi:hypothetical protein|nr:FIST C-terminal domain-containing protein [Treponema sp.]